jgi:tetratricopeptide (TPR) repeat protein
VNPTWAFVFLKPSLRETWFNYLFLESQSIFMKAFCSSLFLLVFLFFCSHHLLAQENTKLDSLLNRYKTQPDDTSKVKTLQSLFQSYLYNQPKQALDYAEKSLQLAQEIGFKKGIARSYYDIGVYYSNASLEDSTLIYYNKAKAMYDEISSLEGHILVKSGMSIFEFDRGNLDAALHIQDTVITLLKTKINDSVALARAYGIKGSIHIQKGNYRIALTQILEQIKILETLDQKVMLADSYNNLAAIELTNENYKKSIDYNLKALAIYKEYNDTFYQAIANNDIGMAYYNMEDYNKAETYLQNGLKLAQDIENINLEATILANLGITNTKLGRYEQALVFGKKSLRIVKEINSKNKIVENLNGLGVTYSAMGDEISAIAYFDQVIPLADSIGNKAFQSLAYMERATSYANVNNHKKAYNDLKVYLKLKDSIYNKNKSKQIEEMRAIFDTEKKEQQIAQQEIEIELLEEKEKVSNLQKILLGGGLGLSLLLLGFGFYGFRQKAKSSQLEKEKIEAELLYKKKELTTHALHLAKKNEVLEGLKQKAKKLKQAGNIGEGYQELIKTINFDQQDDQVWENFTRYFEAVHKDFEKEALEKFPDITKNELRLIALLKMNLSSKEIATILNISSDGIKKARQRLRKKMNLSSKESLETAIMSI